MAIYNTHQVDERYSPILEPNLYANSLFVPGVTCTDQYQVGPAGAIMVQKLGTTPAEPGTPGRDFVDEVASSDLIPIALNNNFQKSKKIYGVVAKNVSFQAGEAHLSVATQEVREGRDNSGLAALVQEGTAAAVTTAITNAKSDIIKTRAEISKAKGSADIVFCHPDFYGQVLEQAGTDFAPNTNERIISTGNVGRWLGMTFVECPGLAATNAKYYDHTGALKTVAFAGVQYVMYRAAALSIIDNFNLARLLDSERFAGTLAQVEVNAGYRVTNPVLARVRNWKRAACVEHSVRRSTVLPQKICGWYNAWRATGWAQMGRPCQSGQHCPSSGLCKGGVFPCLKALQRVCANGCEGARKSNLTAIFP